MRRLILTVVLGLAPVGAAAAPLPFEPVATLESTPPCFDCAFGDDVTAVGSRVLVTQSRRMPGAVQLFDATNGRLLRSFASPEPDRTFDTFGVSIAVVGDRYLLVGAPWGTAGGEDGPVQGGVAYLFDLESGALRHTLTARAPREWDRFGASVAALGTVALVWGGRESVVYAFDAETGTLLRVYPAPSAHDAFLVDRPIASLDADVVVGDGDAIQVLDGATGAVRLTIARPDGAALGTRVVTHAGDVYVEGGLGVYRFDGRDGTLVRRYDGFTGPLAVSECTLLVRGPTCGEPGFAAGAYLLDADTGRTLAVVCAPEHAYVPHFASAGAIVGDRILLGDPSEDEQTVSVFAPQVRPGVVPGAPGGPRCLARAPFPPSACSGTGFPRGLARRVGRIRRLLDGRAVSPSAAHRASRLIRAVRRIVGARRLPIEPACRAAVTAYLDALARRLG